MLEGVSIGEFRGFSDFELHGLAPITIVTGDNGTGKTNLLRALTCELGDDSVRFTCERSETPVIESELATDRMESASAMPLGSRAARFIGAFDRVPDPEGDLKRYLAARLARRSEALVEGLRTIIADLIDVEFLPYEGNNQFVVRDRTRYWSLEEKGAGAGALFKLLVAIDSMPPGATLAIDEIATGFYIGRLPDIFRAIVAARRAANIQLIVTTQSDEALTAFVNATEDGEGQKDLAVVRMYRDDENRSRALCLEERIVRNAVREGFDLR